MEGFIKKPNLPEGKVSLFLVDGRISHEMEEKLKNKGGRIIKTERIEGVYEAIAWHPDIMLHHLGGNSIVLAPNIHNKIAYSLEEEGFNLIQGRSPVGEKYPHDVAYNAARIGRAVVCNTKYTDPVLLEKSMELGLKIIHAKQGYSKCSICVVEDNAVITSDRGLHNILIINGIDSLLISPGYIELFEMNYGFIGGATGFLSKDDMGFYGSLKSHPDCEKIKKHLKKYGKNPVNLSENRMVDLGTLIPLKEYSILMP